MKWLAAVVGALASALVITAASADIRVVNDPGGEVTSYLRKYNAMLGYNAADRTFLQYWMSGYYNAAASSDILDFKRLETNTAKVLAYCKKNKSMTLAGAINKVAR